MAPKVFLSYRRNDSPHASGRLRDRLAMEFGEKNVFYDVDSIPTGRDFREEIRTAIQAADAVVVMIGPGFDVDRLNDRRDYVRMELLEAFRQKKVIVPVLVDTALMPAAAALPSSLRRLAHINASPIRQDPDFRRDSERLIANLRNEPAISGIAHADRQSRLDTIRDEHLADRYSRAIEQLGSDNLDIRIGAVNTLGGWLTGDDPARAMTARQKLQQIADTDNPAASAVAAAYLAGPSRATAATGPHSLSAQSGETTADRRRRPRRPLHHR